MAQYDTVANIVGDVATELGLGTIVVDFASGDPNVLQLLKLLTTVGRGLMLRYPWLQQKTDYSFVTTSATVYNLPADFSAYVNQTGWNRSTRQPLVTLSPQQWEMMKAVLANSSFPVFFRPGFASAATGLPTLELMATPTAGQTIAFEYTSRLWVRPAGASPTFLDAPTATTDTIRFDSQLATRALRTAWLEAKGFDSTAARQDYEEMLEAVRSANVQAAPVLSLNGAGSGYNRLLDGSNVPDSGFGS